MAGAFKIKISGVDVSRHVKRDSLQELQVQAEGRLLWDFRVDSLSIEAGRRIFGALGFTEGDYLSFNRLTVEVFYYGARKFAGWISSGTWDKKTATLSLEIDSVGMIVKDFKAGYWLSNESASPFTSNYIEGDWIGYAFGEILHSMTIETALQYLSRNINTWLIQLGYSGFIMGTPEVSVRDFEANAVIEALDPGVSSLRLNEGTPAGEEFVGIFYDDHFDSSDPDNFDFFLIVREWSEVDTDGGGRSYRSKYWKYLLTETGVDISSKTFISYGSFSGLDGQDVTPENFVASLNEDGSVFYLRRVEPTSSGGFYFPIHAVYRKVTRTHLSEPDAQRLDVCRNFWAVNYGMTAGTGRGVYVIGSTFFEVADTETEDDLLPGSPGRVIFCSREIGVDKHSFIYDAGATVGEVLHDLAVMTDALVGFNYTLTGSAVSIFAQNREEGTAVNTTGLIDLKRKFREQTDEEFEVPSAFLAEGAEILPTVQEDIENYYQDRLNRDAEMIETLVHRSQFEDASQLSPGKRLHDVRNGDLGQIKGITYRETSIAINSQKRARS